MEILTWDPQTTLYEEQEAAMTNSSGEIIHNTHMRGLALVINELNPMTVDMADIMHNCNFHQVLQSHVAPMTVDMADIMHNCNFHQVLQSHVAISSLDTSPNGNVQTCRTVSIDSLTLAAC